MSATAEPEISGKARAIARAVAERDAQFVALAGIPGSGKSTVAETLRNYCPRAIVVPMDGYHLPRRMLDAEGMRRRGAPHTFDHARFRADLLLLKATGAGAFPAFDHSEGDPRENAIKVGATERPVVVEGLYLLLADWRLDEIFDLRVFIDCPIELAMRRLSARHQACGLARDAASAQLRIDSNDRLNAQLILADGGRERADLVI